MTNECTVGICYEALAPRLSEQLEAQGLKHKDTHELVLLQRMVDSINMLGVHCIVTDKQKQDVHKKIQKRLAKGIVEL